MELKEYQQKALSQVKGYLGALAKETKEGNIKHASLDAWLDVGLKNYRERQNGLGQDLPNFCLKIPTGGGKTFLAVKAIDLLNTIYLKKRTGLILWVVPTNQIYQQTIKSLRNRDHPYRQHLDIASGGQTLILEKTDRFSPLDVTENLCVLMLMLPSASRQNKETLRMFRDSGGFGDFFPAEDDILGHQKLLEQIPNLDCFSMENGFWGKQTKTSLGNTLRTLSPVIILDEGHKAYSEIAQATLRGFNPSLILELSATPVQNSNILVDIKGTDLNHEEMIKLDLHIINKIDPEWKNTLLSAVEKRNKLEEKAREYEANTNINIRPICLIQVERTGKDQRSGRFIHSEDAREYLTKIAGIPEEQVKVTSAELKEIEGIDLMTRNCSVRYIITKQALQEGWDCAFAYVLTILTNPSSKNALTQLVGRILRQPFARKTKIKELDESYVFVFQQKTVGLLTNIKDGFEQEGLGDLAGRIAIDAETNEINTEERAFNIREKFKKIAKKIILPVFAVSDSGKWRLVNYETDIASQISWNKVNLEPLFSLTLSEKEEKNIEVAVNLVDEKQGLIKSEILAKTKDGGLKIDEVFLARHILDIVPNPWIAYEFGKKVLAKLLGRYNNKIVANNFLFIIEELQKYLTKEKNHMAQEVFFDLLSKELLRFIVFGKNLGFKFRQKTIVKPGEKRLCRADGEPLQQSLFEFVSQDDFNETEKEVALYLENQEKLLFWYRNMVRGDYAIQGWHKQKVYPDFIFTGNSKIFVVETKGIHLKGSEDTDYKQTLFDLCNKEAVRKDYNELGLDLQNLNIRYEMIYGDEWQRRLNDMLE
ncbi:restriction endonuclease subunit R [Candidatus Roizmanbacteria bacterium RIFCSPHIGHO2_12_FULL_41_11]|uniref:Restriction endonuclease subunit R n=2 Tax=Candidatus Roizmaniibacteriota TaxID=1752723 RepID=A0A1F7JRH1_9BACT|nr:MAG: restriction endonuclease subunit R [Candidatus Roizmanbacteria bacterium RIFCSPHIGHO2_12_FULL_41_11]OGK58214.1 MAG: restriction endonuclease subunit R [Candidatus Roizmanbacteria bacterium RIFCSPLOWO2_02_FULL_41_9]